MARGKYNVYAAQCPTRQALDWIADKWTALIVGLLAERTHRFGGLRRNIDGISHKVLVQTLRSLERDGLVHREPLDTTPPNGRVLAHCAWTNPARQDVNENMSDRKQAVPRFKQGE